MSFRTSIWSSAFRRSEISEQPADKVWRDGADAPWMATLSAGEFMMGENRGDKFAGDIERPAHRVRVSAFAIGVFPVTAGEFRCFRSRHGAADAENLPAVHASWHDARAFCDWLTERTGRHYRLPTEAEWEYACRAGSQTLFSCGDELAAAAANFLYDEQGTPIGVGARTPAGTYPPNAFGVCDLHGNVCEWVEDAWHPHYRGAPSTGIAWTGRDNLRRVIRGGAWDYLPRLLRSCWRDWRLADYRGDNLGFRVATDLENSFPA
jgi:formylglycine-generating enzyme required for sulfatase activity